MGLYVPISVSLLSPSFNKVQRVQMEKKPIELKSLDIKDSK